MATPNCTGVKRRLVRLEGNRSRNHPKHCGRKATGVRPPFAERDECPKDSDALDCDVHERLFRTTTGWRTTDARVDGQERIEGEL